MPLRNERAARGVSSQRPCAGSDAGVAAGDAFDLEARDAEVVELAIGELRQLAHGLAVAEPGTDARQNPGYEHENFLFLRRPTSGAGRHAVLHCSTYVRRSA